MNKHGKLLGEFVAIVLGVLVALMVDTWIDQRHDDSLRQEYLARLASDLEADRLSLEYRVSFFGAVRSYGLQTLEWLRSDQPPDQGVLLAAYYAAEIWPFAPVGNTYEDLQNTGNIGLLEDMDLRMQLASYHANAYRRQNGWVIPENYREIVRGVIPAEIQLQIRARCPTLDASGTIPTGFRECTLPGVTLEELGAAMAPLRTKTGLLETLSYHVSEVDVAIRLYEQQADSARKILERMSPR